MFRGPDFIAKLSDGLKIIDPIFITCGHWQTDFCDKFKTFEASFWPLKPVVCFVHQSTDVAPIKNLLDFKMLLQNKVNR